MTTRSWESVRLEQKNAKVEQLAQVAMRGIKEDAMNGALLAVALVGLLAFSGTFSGEGSKAKDTGTIELQDGNYIVRIFLKGDDYIVLEGHYIDRALIWNQHRFKFARQSAAIKFAEKSLKLKLFTQPYMVSAAFRKAHLVE
jgi:hypothetical protein